MHRLARERAEAGRDEEQPGQQFRPVFRRTEEFAGLVGQIEQDRAGIENPRLSAAGPFGIDDRGHFAVRIDLPEGGQMLLAFARVDRHHFVGQACLFEKERDFGRVRRRMEVKADHLEFSFCYLRADGRLSPPDRVCQVR